MWLSKGFMDPVLLGRDDPEGEAATNSEVQHDDVQYKTPDTSIAIPNQFVQAEQQSHSSHVDLRLYHEAAGPPIVCPCLVYYHS